MSEIKVPHAMRERIRARVEEFLHGPADAIEFDATVDAFAEELAKNPIVPTNEQVKKMKDDLHPNFAPNYVCFGSGDFEDGAVEWQRRMFLSPEPEIPEEVEDLLWGEYEEVGHGNEANAKIIEAYRRGRASGEKWFIDKNGNLDGKVHPDNPATSKEE